MKQYLETLNAQQQQAIQHPLSELMVVAGPGTGKTKTLIGRIAAIINEPFNIPPEAILAVTFTNQARNEMQERLLQLVGNKAFKVTISTMHGFCLRVLQKYAEFINIPNDFIIADEMIQFRLLSRCVNSQDLRSLHHVRDIISQYRFDVNYPLEIDEQKVQRWVNEYDEQLMKHNMIDFDQMLLKTRDLFDSFPEVVESYQNQYSAILIDEFQDTDLVQYEIFKHLAEEHRNIFVVCDEDQSIYAFRGANVTNIARFQEDFNCSVENGNVIILNDNYRSQQSIIDMASGLIEKYRLNQKEIKAVFQRDAIPEFHVCADNTVETQFIIDRIQHYRESGIKLSDIAVLYPTNFLAENLEPDLIEAKIPYVLHTSQSLADYDDLERVKVFLTLIYKQWLLDASDKDTFIQRTHEFDVMFERFFIMYSGLQAYTIQLIKYQQGVNTFQTTLERFYTQAFQDSSNWILNIEKYDFITAYEHVYEVIDALFADLAISNITSVQDILEVLEKYLPVRPLTLYFACEEYLIDPLSLEAIHDNFGLFQWFLQEYAEDDREITVYIHNNHVYTIVETLLDRVLNVKHGLNVSISQDNSPQETPTIKIALGKSKECLLFEQGVYGLFKFLQTVDVTYSQKSTIQDYITFSVERDDTSIHCINICEVQEHVLIHEKTFTCNETTNDVNSFVQQSGLGVFLKTFNPHLPILYLYDEIKSIIETYCFIAQKLLHVESFIKFAYPDKSDDLLSVFQDTDTSFVDNVIHVVRSVDAKESLKQRKTSLEKLVPLLSFGLYREYISFPDKLGVNFKQKTESLNLFLWGNLHFEDFSYPEHITNLWKQQKTDILDFISMFRDDVGLQIPFDQGFVSLVSLSARFIKQESILNNIRDFLNSISLVGIGQLFNMDAVQISTIHAAKGKEYTVVIVGGLDNGINPSTHSLKFKANYGSTYLLDEQRRVLYVALTRARQYLHLIHTQKRFNRKNNPSIFLEEMGLIDKE